MALSSIYTAEASTALSSKTLAQFEANEPRNYCFGIVPC